MGATLALIELKFFLFNVQRDVKKKENFTYGPFDFLLYRLLKYICFCGLEMKYENTIQMSSLCTHTENYKLKMYFLIGERGFKTST